MMFHRRNRLLVVLVLTARWLVTEGCLWCDPKKTSRFTNCLFLEIVSDPTLDILERDMLVDMKSSLFSASKSISKSSGDMKESIMNGALAGEVSGMIASHSAATGQDPAVATSEVMRLIGRCYYSVTQQSEVHFVKTLRKAVDDMVVDEMNDSDYGSGVGAINNPPQNFPNGRGVPSKEPPNSQQSSASAFANSGYLPPANNPNPAPGISRSEVVTPYNVKNRPQSNGMPPTRENVPFYLPRTNEGNSRAEAFATSNTGPNDRVRNDGVIRPFPENFPSYPSRTNDNAPSNSGAGVSSGFDSRPDFNKATQIQKNVPFYPAIGNLPPPSYSNLPPSFSSTNFKENTQSNSQFINNGKSPSSTAPKEIMLPPTPGGVPSDAKLPSPNFQDSGIRQFNQNFFENPPPKQNWENQSPPAVFQGSKVSVNKFSNNVPDPSMDKEFRQFQEAALRLGPNNNGFVYPPIQDKNFNNIPPTSETRVPENQGNEYPLLLPSLENKPVGSGSGPQLPPLTNSSPTIKNNNVQGNGYSGQSLVPDSSKRDNYPGYQSNLYSSTNQSSGFPNGNFQKNTAVVKDTWEGSFLKPVSRTDFTLQRDDSKPPQTQGSLQVNNNPQVLNVDGGRNQYADSRVQKNAYPIKNPTYLNQTPNQPNNGFEIPQQTGLNNNLNPTIVTQQASSSSFNSPVSSAAKSDNRNFALKQPLPENQPNNGQYQFLMKQNAWNVNVPTSNSERVPQQQPGSSKTNPGESTSVNKSENCARTFYLTLRGKLLETNELSSILGTDSIPLLVKDSVAEATRRTFIDIGYSAYSDEVFNYCAIQIASLNERSGTQAYAEKIAKSVTDVLLKNNASVGNCVDGAKSVALHVLRWLEVFFKSDDDDFNSSSNSASSSSSSGNSASQSNDSTSKDNKGVSGSQDNVNDYDYSNYDYENCDDEEEDELQDGDDDCEDQQSESSSSPNEDEICDDEQETTSPNKSTDDVEEGCDDEQESSSPNESTDVDNDCDDDEQQSSSPNKNADNDEDCNDEQSESSSQQDNTNNGDGNNGDNNDASASSASNQQNGGKESELSNYESKNQIELLMSSARHSMSPSGFNLDGFVSVMSSVAGQLRINHPDWNSNKVQVKTFTQSLLALTLVLQDLAYPNSK